MATTAEILKSKGLSNAEALVAAAKAVGLPIHIAAAFAKQESNGQNIYGHDRGGVFSYAGRNLQVTAKNYAEFYNEVVNRKKTSNGVGPMQITYPGYFPQAKAQGFKLWEPYDNFRFGFQIIKNSLRGDYSVRSLNAAAQRYNSGSPTGAPSYGASVVGLSVSFFKALQGAVSGPAKPPVDVVTPGRLGVVGAYPLPSGEYFGLDNGKPESHSGARIQDRDNIRRIQRELGLSMDGSFGYQTEKAVKAYQKLNNLETDGRVGPNTWSSMTKTGIL